MSQLDPSEDPESPAYRGFGDQTDTPSQQELQ